MDDQVHLHGARRRAPRAVAMLAAFALVLGILASPSGGQAATDDEPPKTEAEQERADAARDETLELAAESPPSPDDPFAAVVEADAVIADLALDRLEVTGRANAAAEQALVAAEHLIEVTQREDAAKVVRSDAIDELSTERARLSDLTVRAYVTGSQTSLDEFAAIVDGDTTDPSAGREIMFTQVLDLQEEITETAASDLKKARAKLRKVRVELASAQEEATRRLNTSSELTRRRIEAEQAHNSAIFDAEAARNALRAAGNRAIQPVSEDVAIIGMPRLSAEDLASWFALSPYRPRVSTPIEDYATWFIEEGAEEGIRGDIAFAQAVLETGGFANNDTVNANNFSGIGHCDTCASGWKFPSPKLGVRAQIQLLKSYAVRKPNYVNPLVDKRLRGPAGCCDTWGDLTTVWATDPTYGPKVMFLYTAIVDHALKRRARGEGFEVATD